MACQLLIGLLAIQDYAASIGMPEIWGKLTFRLNLRYHALDEKIWLREEDRLGAFTRAKRPQTSLGQK
jgi:hypothetical protein